MKWFLSLLAVLAMVGWADRDASAQPSYGAQAYAEQQQAEQRWKKLSAQMEEMLASQEALRKRIQELEEENRRLLKKINDSGSSSVSPATMNDVVDQLEKQIQQVDKNRQTDFEKLNRDVDRRLDLIEAAVKKQLSSGGGGSRSAAPSSGEFYTHKIQAGQTISAVAAAFRAQGISVSESDIIAANPGINPRTLQVGQVIKIPKP